MSTEILKEEIETLYPNCKYKIIRADSLFLLESEVNAFLEEQANQEWIVHGSPIETNIPKGYAQCIIRLAPNDKQLLTD